MAPGAGAHGALMYVSDVFARDVLVYDYRTKALVGTLTGFSEPQGECVDHSGDVWIVDTEAAQLIEYAHGGTEPIKELSDPGQDPLSCTVNSQNTVAVANVQTYSAGAGSLAIYENASGTPQIYTDAAFQYMDFLSFGPGGAVFLDGANSAGYFQMAKFDLGSKSFTPITIGGTPINAPGGIVAGSARPNLWVGDQHGDYDNSVVYEVTTGGTVLKTVQLAGSTDCVQYAITRRKSRWRLLCPNAVIYPPYESTLSIYGKRGKLLQSVSGFNYPVAVVVSP